MICRQCGENTAEIQPAVDSVFRIVKCPCGYWEWLKNYKHKKKGN